jgi:hypothetical protein
MGVRHSWACMPFLEDSEGHGTRGDAVSHLSVAISGMSLDETIG